MAEAVVGRREFLKTITVMAGALAFVPSSVVEIAKMIPETSPGCCHISDDFTIDYATNTIRYTGDPEKSYTVYDLWCYIRDELDDENMGLI